MRKVFGYFLILVMLAAPGALFWQRQSIMDWAALRDYTPPATIAQLASDVTMTDYGRKLFYVNHPKLEDKAAFNQHCSSQEKSIILGCYISRSGIYLYDVTDERLTGVEQVTAAHEMLHAAYERLSAGEQRKVDAMTAAAYATMTDQRVKDTVALYSSHDASVVPNELHSILATELRQLPSDLETYYTRYFTKRSAIVDYSDRYESEFATRKAKVDAYDVQLKALKDEIDRSKQQLESQQATINLQRKQMDTHMAAREYEAYNAMVSSFNALVRSYNALIVSTEAKIDQYNQVVKDRNAIALEEDQLAQALDSRLAPAEASAP